MADIDIRERQYVSQYATDLLGLVVHKAGVPNDVDSGMNVSLIREIDNAVILSRLAGHAAIGTYETSLTAQESSLPGLYTVVWVYTMAGIPQEYRTYVEIGQSQPDYDLLPNDMKDIVDSVWARLADLYDSPGGGPNLQTYFQTHFGRGRIAQLLRIACGTLNTVAQPFQTYTVDGVGQAAFPTAQWGPLLERALYIEVLKHLIRSYVEQPLFMGGSVTRLDRRDYIDRWRSILSDEEPTFRSQLEIFKISNMGMGRPAVLVSGGVYGRYGPTRLAGSAAARPRMWTRWY